MKRRNATRSALFTSIISLLLCVSMLVGTTFAWFTDTVTSGNNIIASGNLDVEMYWADGTEAVPTVDADWTDASTGAIFNYKLWEPGYTEVRHIKIANEGSLALKYQLLIQANGEVSKLADVIDVYFVDPAQQITGRAALADVQPEGTLSEVLATMPTSTSGTLAAGKEITVTLALKMQESAGNEYQDLAIGTDFSVVLVATQLTAETDSFDDQYDKDAKYPAVAIVKGDATTPTKLESDNTTVEIPVGAEAGSYNLETSDITTTTDEHGNVTATMDITLKKDGVKVENNGTTYNVSVDIGAGLNLTKLFHDGVEITDYTYDIASGIVNFTTNHFSPFSFVYDTVGAKVASVDELVEAVEEGGLITLNENVTISETLNISESTVINGNGNTLTYTGANRAINVDNGADADADLVIDNLTITCTASFCERGINYNDSGKLVLNNVSITGTNVNYPINLPASSKNAKVTINGSNITGNMALNVWGEKVEIVANNSNFRSYYVSDVEACAVIKFNDANGYAAKGSKLTVNGGSIISDAELVAVEVVAAEVSVNISEETVVQGAIEQPVVAVFYKGQNEFHTSRSLERAIELAENNSNATITLLQNIEQAEPIVIDGTVVIDLNGNVLSGTCNDNQDYLIMVNNGAELTVKDSSSAQTGKITFAKGNSNVGWTIDLEGVLNLYSGTIELTGDDWSIGYAVDVRPNAWGAAYTEGTVFHMYGGKVISSDGAIRVASSSSADYQNVSASFIMEDGVVDAEWDGIFVQQSDAAYDTLSVEIKGGSVSSALAPIRVYGPVATSVVAGTEKPMTITVNGGNLVMKGEPDTSRVWYVEGKIVLGGGMTVAALEQYTTITVK